MEGGDGERREGVGGVKGRGGVGDAGHTLREWSARSSTPSGAAALQKVPMRRVCLSGAAARGARVPVAQVCEAAGLSDMGTAVWEAWRSDNSSEYARLSACLKLEGPAKAQELWTELAPSDFSDVRLYDLGIRIFAAVDDVPMVCVSPCACGCPRRRDEVHPTSPKDCIKLQRPEDCRNSQYTPEKKSISPLKTQSIPPLKKIN